MSTVTHLGGRKLAEVKNDLWQRSVRTENPRHVLDWMQRLAQDTASLSCSCGADAGPEGRTCLTVQAVLAMLDWLTENDQHRVRYLLAAKQAQHRN